MSVFNGLVQNVVADLFLSLILQTLGFVLFLFEKLPDRLFSVSTKREKLHFFSQRVGIFVQKRFKRMPHIPGSNVI